MYFAAKHELSTLPAQVREFYHDLLKYGQVEVCKMSWKKFIESFFFQSFLSSAELTKELHWTSAGNKQELHKIFLHELYK